jgi:hypothetical protein
MADGDRATFGVDQFRVNSPGLDAGQRLDREGLVQLDRTDVGPTQTSPT